MKKKIISVSMIAIVLLILASCAYDLRGVNGVETNNNQNRENKGSSYQDKSQDTNEETNALYVFYENGLQGFRDASGKVIIEPQYLYVHSFSEGLAFVRGVEGKEYQTGFIDLTGELIIPLPNVFSVVRFSEGLVPIRIWDGTGDAFRDPRLPLEPDIYGHVIFINREGEDVFGQKFLTAAPFSEGLAFVRGIEGYEHMTGFIDITGKLVIPLPDAVVGGSFSEGFASIIEREWDWANETALAVGTPGPFIFIDRTGTNIFGQEFGSVQRFIEGFARVTIPNGNTIFIDRTGENIFGLEFRRARDFENGYAKVTMLDDREVTIDTSGNIVRR